MDTDTTDTMPHKTELRSALYSFFGNSLLKVMTEETAFGLDPEFWEQFKESFGLDVKGESEVLHSDVSEHVEKALADLQGIANELQNKETSEALERVGVEYTRLFIGPGTPDAPPWETLYREGGSVLFGQATFDMKQLLNKQGYKASEESRQLEDHIGFELLYLALRFSEQDAILSESAAVGIKSFICEHPLSFIDKLHEKAVASCAEHPRFSGYYPALIELIWGILLQDASLEA